MTYKIGTRVKKVANRNIGNTGIVVSGPATDGWTLDRSSIGADIYVKHDQCWQNNKGKLYKAGDVSMTRSENWTPIIPSGHRAGEEGRCEPLDKLLSEVSRETV